MKRRLTNCLDSLGERCMYIVRIGNCSAWVHVPVTNYQDNFLVTPMNSIRHLPIDNYCLCVT